MPINTASVIYSAENEPSFINSMEEDITGDGIREYIKLEGNLLSDSSKFYTDVWVNIESPFAQQWKISFIGGYHPKLELLDITHDNTVDLIYESAVKENGRHYNYQLYTLKNGKVQQIELPKNKYAKGVFVDDFKINIQISPNDKVIVQDIADKKTTYVNEQLYDKTGKLLKKQQLTIFPISQLKPILISKSKGYGLKTIQEVRGINDKDVIGEIGTLWYYKENEWIKLRTDWKYITNS